MADFKNPLYGMTKEEVLYELLMKEFKYYTSIFEITRQENEKLTAHLPLSEIGPLLKKKKIFLSCIAEIENALHPLKKHWQTKRDRSDPASLNIKQALADLDKLLKQILELDLVSQQMLESYFDSLKSPSPPKTPPPPKAPPTNPFSSKKPRPH